MYAFGMLVENCSQCGADQAGAPQQTCSKQLRSGDQACCTVSMGCDLGTMQVAFFPWARGLKAG